MSLNIEQMDVDLENANAATETAAAAVDSSAALIGRSMEQPWSPDLVITLSVSILIFSLLVIALATFLLKQRDADQNTILKIFGLVLIICMSAFLLVVGYGKDQLTPIIGLFGAIAGYLLGKDTSDPRASAPSDVQKTP